LNANAEPLLEIFDSKLRLEVPLFQRQYVWNRSQQWEPLWEDISRKFLDHLQGRVDAPVHFLGAMVLDQKFTPTSHVVRRQVIDGQQRLTTLQIFLAAFRDFCTANACAELAKECRSFTLNSGMMADPEADRYKVWPTSLDRSQFMDVISSESRAEVEKRHPRVRQKYARRDDPRPRMVEAYLFFYDQLHEFFFGEDRLGLDLDDVSLCDQLEECFKALKTSLQVVIIDLDQGDDPQVIFESLNARGEPLLPADLLRNYIFLRAGRVSENQEELYQEYWSGFDEQFWRHEIRQGRLNRPRSDLFMQHFLASRLATDVSAKHLYVEYKHWIEKSQPFTSIRDELATLARQREDFRRIIAPTPNDVLAPLSRFLDVFDVSTAAPALLYALDAELADKELQELGTHIESYILRRAVCGLTTKNYNRIFLGLTRQFRTAGASAKNVAEYLSTLTGESSVWPSDVQFQDAWQSQHAYQVMNSPRIIYILSRINDTYMSGMTEHISIASQLTVEHILPSTWIKHWPLPNGSKGLTYDELLVTDDQDPRVEATRRRNRLIHTMGNLTILGQPLNSTLSNAPWELKRPLMLSRSLLPINLELRDADVWNEEAIQERSRQLFQRASSIWPLPLES
jgi:uncharacterized protein with ParB-like and HNH nuclease domain